MDEIILRNKIAERVAYNVCNSVATSIKAENLIQWHKVNISNLYISERDHFECQMTATRGWDTDIEIDISSNAEASKDRLTDYTINRIRKVIRDTVEDNTDITFERLERITRVRINTTVNTDSTDQPSYRVEFETKNFESNILKDEKMSGMYRIAGRRIIVNWIWNKHIRSDMDAEELVEYYDGTVTAKDIKSAINFARESDEFDEPEQIENDDNADAESFEDIEESLGDTTYSDLPDVEDLR